MQKLFDKPIKEFTIVSGYLIPCSLFALALLISLFKVTSQDICIDEPFSIYHAQFSIPDLIKWLKPTNNPPLFEMLLHFWIKLFGISPLSVRVLPVLFSALTVIYIYRTGARFFSMGIGLTASILYIFSTHAIYYAHDCRVYSLFIFLTTISVYFTCKIINNESNRKDLFILFIINLVMVYAHYFGFIVWLVEFGFMLLFNRNALKNVTLIFLLALLLYAPQIISLAHRFQFSAIEGTWMKEPTGLESVYNLLWKFSNMPVVTVISIVIILSSIFIFFKQGAKNINKISLFISFFFVSVLMGMFLVSYVIPVFNARYLSFLLPVYYLMVSICATCLIKNARFRFLIPVVLVSLFAFTVNVDPYKKREAKAVTEYINSIKKPGDLLIICTHEFLTNYAFYTDTDLFTAIGSGEYGNLENALRKRNVYPVTNVNELDPILIDNAERVIYLDAGADFSNPGNNVLGTLQNKLKSIDKKHFEEIFDVYLFQGSN